MAKQTHIRINGEWRKVKNVWIKVNDEWKQKVIPKGRIDGVWKQFMQYYTPAIFYFNAGAGGGGGFSVVKRAGDGSLVYSKSFTGNFVRSIATDNDGNLYALGMTSEHVSDTVYLAKANSGGIIEWSKSSSYPYYEYSSVDVDKDYNVHVIRPFYERWDKNGTAIPYNVDNYSSNRYLAVDADRSLYFARSDGYVYKQSFDGAAIWSVRVATGPLKKIVVDHNKVSYSIASSAIAKISASGSKLYDKYVEAGLELDDIAVDKKGNIYVTLSSGRKLKKLDTNADLIWEKTDVANTFRSVSVDPDGFVYTVGVSGLRKYDSGGNLVMSKNDDTFGTNYREGVCVVPGLLGAFPEYW